MKKIHFILALLAIFFLASCNNEIKKSGEKTNDTKNESEHYEFVETKADNFTKQELTQTRISFSSLSFEEGKTIDLPEVGLQDVVVSIKAKNNYSLTDSTAHYVYLLNDFRNSEDCSRNSYLVVENGSEVLLFDLETSSFADQLYSCDIDGDQIDEFVLHQAIAFTGGAGQYVSRIFKIQEHELHEIFNSRVDLSTKTERIFYTGFQSEFMEGKKLKITNSITGYNVVLDISKKYTNEFFDAAGKGIVQESIECDSFYEFQPKDFNGDNIFVIECLQYASLYSHGNGIGIAQSVLKYNKDTREMEVIESTFFESKPS